MRRSRCAPGDARTCRKMPCQVPSASLLFATGIESWVWVRAARRCAGMSPGPSSSCSYGPSSGAMSAIAFEVTSGRGAAFSWIRLMPTCAGKEGQEAVRNSAQGQHRAHVIGKFVQSGPTRANREGVSHLAEHRGSLAEPADECAGSDNAFATGNTKAPATPQALSNALNY